VGHYGFRSLTNEPYTRRLTLSSLLPELQSLGVDLCLSANDRFQQILDRADERAITVELRDVNGGLTYRRRRDRQRIPDAAADSSRGKSENSRD
jgi:hypothetical protein